MTTGDLIAAMHSCTADLYPLEATKAARMPWSCAYCRRSSTNCGSIQHLLLIGQPPVHVMVYRGISGCRLVVLFHKLA